MNILVGVSFETIFKRAKLAFITVNESTHAVELFIQEILSSLEFGLNLVRGRRLDHRVVDLKLMYLAEIPSFYGHKLFACSGCEPNDPVVTPRVLDKLSQAVEHDVIELIDNGHFAVLLKLDHALVRNRESDLGVAAIAYSGKEGLVHVQQLSVVVNDVKVFVLRVLLRAQNSYDTYNNAALAKTSGYRINLQVARILKPVCSTQGHT